MQFIDIVYFIENKMSMSHIYQPLLIKTLVESGGSSTLRSLAGTFLSQDESQLMYYEDTLKRMPVRVLSKRYFSSFDGTELSG